MYGDANHIGPLFHVSLNIEYFVSPVAFSSVSK